MSHENLGLIVVISSLPTLEAAQVMARKLIEHRLAACVQIHDGIHSIYRWEGKICEEKEVLLCAKTVSDYWIQISNFIKSNHPYDLPEIIAYSLQQYEEQYGKWVQAELKLSI